MGRFLGRDPLGSGYPYAGNNPVNRVDPTGLEWICPWNDYFQDFICFDTDDLGTDADPACTCFIYGGDPIVDAYHEFACGCVANGNNQVAQATAGAQAVCEPTGLCPVADAGDPHPQCVRLELAGGGQGECGSMTLVSDPGQHVFCHTYAEATPCSVLALAFDRGCIDPPGLGLGADPACGLLLTIASGGYNPIAACPLFIDPRTCRGPGPRAP